MQIQLLDQPVAARPHCSRILPGLSGNFNEGAAFSQDQQHRKQTGWIMSDAYRFGIEEEYFLVDAATKSVAREMPEAFLQAAVAATGGQVTVELLQSQVEAATVPHVDVASAREELRHLRTTLAE